MEEAARTELLMLLTSHEDVDANVWGIRIAAAQRTLEYYADIHHGWTRKAIRDMASPAIGARRPQDGRLRRDGALLAGIDALMEDAERELTDLITEALVRWGADFGL